MGLCLPREQVSIPVVRHICRDALHEVGVDHDCAADIEVALAEACTNVLEHSGPGEEYEVHVTVDHRSCVIRVVDAGAGFDSESLPGEAGYDPSAEGGRGIALMRALVDRVHFESKPEAGTIVHLEKRLAFLDGSPVGRLRAAAD